jgi:hypothetical protein
MSRKRRTSDAPPADATTAGASVEGDGGELSGAEDGPPGATEAEGAPTGDASAVDAPAPEASAPDTVPPTSDAPPADATFSIEGGAHGLGEGASFSR